MTRKVLFGTRVGALLVTLFVILSFTLPMANAESDILGNIRGIEVIMCTDDHPSVGVQKDGIILYRISYTHLEFQYDGGAYTADLAQGDWNTRHELIEHEKFPHIQVSMDKRIEADGVPMGHLHLNIIVFSTAKTSEITFSFALEEIRGLPEGRVFINQQLEVAGDILRRPGDVLPGREPIEYYQFNIHESHTGYYSWSTDARVDGTGSDTLFISLGNNFLIGASYRPDADRVSIDSLELEKTMTGSSIVTVPEPFSHFPSILIGVFIGGAIMGGVIMEKRREFYRDRDTTSVLRLEDSPYYKGKI